MGDLPQVFQEKLVNWGLGESGSKRRCPSWWVEGGLLHPLNFEGQDLAFHKQDYAKWKKDTTKKVYLG